MNLLFKFGKFLHNNFEDFTKPVVLSLGFFGILFAIIGHYGTIGFNLKWFLFFELPLYLFCAWALYSGYKLYNKVRNKNK